MLIQKDRLAESLRGFGSIGSIAFVAILAVVTIFTPAAAAMVLLWAWVSRTPWRDIGLARPANWAKGFVIGAVFLLLEKFVMKAVVLPLLGAPDTNPMFGDLAANPRRALFLVFYIIVGAGFCEELFFRGYLFERLGRLLNRFGTAAARQFIVIILSTAFFTVLHYQQGIPGFENAAITGLVFAATYLMSGRTLWTAVVMHASYDLGAVALNYFHLEAAVSHAIFG